MMSRDTGPGDYIPFLQGLDAAGHEYFLEGGQSVNFWASYFLETGMVDRSLVGYQPFTSADCDLWVSRETLQYIAREHAARFVGGSSPLDVQLGILRLGGDPEKTIDLLGNVFGIPDRETKRACERALVFDGVRVLDPVFLFRSKCHCLLHLDQSVRQDRKHVEMLVLILPAYFGRLHEAAVDGETTERQLIKELKYFRNLGKDKWIRMALDRIGRDLSGLIPWASLAESPLEKVAAYARTTCPP